MMLRTLVVAAALAVAAGPAVAELPKLTIHTYSSFSGQYGPGGEVEKRFEVVCGCDVVFVAAENTGSLFGRLKLEGASSDADVVLGLDLNYLAEAKATGLFQPHGQDLTGLKVPMGWTDDTFAPFDYGHLGFIYDSTKLKNPPTSLKALVDDPNGPKLVLQDPRTSGPGLGFLLWMRAVYGDQADAAWEKLKPRIVTFTKGWSEAYGLFLNGEADMVLSYETSPAYHIGVENETKYKMAPFSDGHYLTVEIAGIPKAAKQPELARRFIAFMVSADFQDVIPEGNWMYPVRAPSAGLPKSFETLIKPDRSLIIAPDAVATHRRAWIDGWLQATTR